MPLDPVNNFSACVQEFIDKGDTPEKAKSRCGAIKADMESANASILKKHTADLPCMCKMLQTATADFYQKDGENYASFFLLNDQMNLKQWAVTAESIPKYLNSFKGKPFISEPELGHFGADDLPVHQVVSKQEEFRVGDIVDVKFDQRTMTAEAIVKFHKTAEAEKIWNDMQRGEAIYVSPAVAGYSLDTGTGNVFYEWYGLHLARVANPAYGVHHASIKKTCTGDEKECINTLVASAMANSSDLKNYSSNLSSFKQTSDTKVKMADTIKEDEKQKGKDHPSTAETDEEKKRKLEEENASLKSQLASLEKRTAQLEETASEVSQLKEQLVEKENEEKEAIVSDIMQIKEQLGVETEEPQQTVEEQTASLMEKSTASLKEQRAFLASISKKVADVGSNKIIRMPESATTASASAEKKPIDMNYIRELTSN